MKRFQKNKRKIVKISQDSDKWLDWRNKGIGSSDVALLMSSEPVFDRTINTLWNQRVGYERPVELDNEHIKRGKELEPIIRDMVNNFLNTKFKPVCMERTDAPYLRASLDGYDEEINAILEIKAPSEKYFKEYLNNWTIPENYYLQMQYQMLVANVDYAYFAFYNKDILHEGEQKHENPYIIPVRSDIELQLEIEKRCALFWRAVEDKTPIGWKDETLSIFPPRPIIYVLITDKPEKYQKMKAVLPIYSNIYSLVSNKSQVFVIGTNYDYIVDLNMHFKGCSFRYITTIENPITNKIYTIKSAKDLNGIILDNYSSFSK